MSNRQTVRSRQQRAVVKGSVNGRLTLYAMMFMCVLVLVTGFFFAARQHFSSMDYGIRNSRLRKQLDDLETEKRRLLLAREVSLSPAEIKKAARKLGIGNVDGEIVQAAVAVKDAKSVVPSPSLVERTSRERITAFSAVPAAFMPNVRKSLTSEKQAKRETGDKLKKGELPFSTAIASR